ncbi:VPS10 domain-containing receptor SorCS1-like isoform X4 [Dysidea avara]|uniref:VPS10 domain-containing receptor SorCS1-like isoform X3 n=1 Tax=Dysidea avara TaxID=196820 RepID=UPI003321E245
MLSVPVRLLVITLLYHCVQGKNVVRRINPSSESSDEWLYKDDISRSENDLSEELTSRIRRNAGRDPVAHTFTLDSDTHQFARVRYAGEGSDVVYVLTYDRNRAGITSSALYRSTDYGKTFQDQSNKLSSGFQLNPSYYTTPVNNRILIIPDDEKSQIYVTTDGGEIFTSYNVPVDPTSLKLHPTMPNWILGSSTRTLWYSRDMGRTWSVLSRNAATKRSDYVWGIPGIDWQDDDTDISRITTVYYNTYDLNSNSTAANFRILNFAVFTGGRYVSEVFDCNLGYYDSFILDGTFIFAARLITRGVFARTELLVSYMRGPFQLARIPSFIEHFGYIVGSYRSSQGLVIVEHTRQYDLYLSDETGVYYSLSLDNVVVDDIYGAIDILLIDSMNGTLIANQFVSTSRSQQNRTVITFDNGARWQAIEAPSLGVDGNPINCDMPNCSLHFHMGSSIDYRRVGVYERDSAPGLIVANGNYGPYLSDDNVNVYITRDGGLNWEQTLAISWHVEIIDHGGLLVAARDDHQVDSTNIMYSCNEGMNWNTFVFTSIPSIVWGILTEPGQTSTNVMLFGNEGGRDNRVWTITTVNFTTIFDHDCIAVDYENWTMSDGRIGDQQCLLGETRIIERRRPDVCCWNRREYERLVAITPCECTPADFECEWGYRRNDILDQCVLDADFGTNVPPNCSTGYRKIAGDMCVGGVSSLFLPPQGCGVSSEPPKTCAGTDEKNDTGTIGKNDTGIIGKNDTETPVKNNTVIGNGGGNTGGSRDDGGDDNGSTVAIVVSVLVAMAILTAVTTVIPGIVYVLYKKKKSNEPVVMSNPVVDMGKGDQKFKRLEEDDATSINA